MSSPQIVEIKLRCCSYLVCVFFCVYMYTYMVNVRYFLYLWMVLLKRAYKRALVDLESSTCKDWPS